VGPGRAEDVEIAKNDCFKAVDAGEDAHVMLGRQLCDGVGGDGVGEHVFAFGRAGVSP